MDLTIRPRHAHEPDVAAVIAAHVAEMDADEHTPPEACHRLEAEGLLAQGIALYGAHDAAGELVGIGALDIHADDDPPWAEIKSMHVPVAHRGRGISRSMLEHLCGRAAAQGMAVVRLETARSLVAAVGLYRTSGFVDRGPFGAYQDHDVSIFMERAVVAG